MSELSQQARALVEAARGRFEPRGADRERVGRSLAVRLGLAAAAGTAATAAGSSAAGSTLGAMFGGTAGKVGLALLVLATSGAGYHLMTRRPQAAVTVPVATGAAPAIAPPIPEGTQPASAASSLVVVFAQPDPAPRGAAADSTGPGPSADNGLEQEVAKLRRAHEALRSGQPERAMSELTPAQTDVLAEERAAMRVLTLCEMGRGQEARAEAQSFLARYPKSPQASRVRAACPGP